MYIISGILAPFSIVSLFRSAKLALTEDKKHKKIKDFLISTKIQDLIFQIMLHNMFRIYFINTTKGWLKIERINLFFS